MMSSSPWTTICSIRRIRSVFSSPHCSDGCDVVYGVPDTEQHGLLRDMASQLTKFALQSTMGAENARNVSAFRAFRTGIRDAFGELPKSSCLDRRAIVVGNAPLLRREGAARATTAVAFRTIHWEN